MSTQQTAQWLDAALDHFEGALEQRNYELAKDVIADVQDAGFLDVGRRLNEILRDTPLSQFSIKSPIQPIDL